MTKLSRRQRRENARKEGVKFTPMYNGNAPITIAEYIALNTPLALEEENV